jgi:hypothetical protein
MGKRRGYGKLGFQKKGLRGETGGGATYGLSPRRPLRMHATAPAVHDQFDEARMELANLIAQ